ncbi:hypothetical protein B7P43_G17530 [Cryptotermes secundus]|uniref:CCHC-type domain-containing protein n=1 Tax=Cryptotermes secundus TaxID=105785 RepID=A0A2J7QH73_9NEOP|nr:hypothetical protein B7P43_G17530 [Cryptotermes secundus]
MCSPSLQKSQSSIQLFGSTNVTPSDLATQSYLSFSAPIRRYDTSLRLSTPIRTKVAVVSAAGILEYQVSESALVRRIVQNIYPSVRTWLTFESEPRSVEELYALASRVAEARAVDQHRESPECRVPGEVSRDERGRCPISMVTTESSRPRSREVRCYKCTRVGHIAKNCLSSNAPVVRRQGGFSVICKNAARLCDVFVFLCV